MTGSHKPNIQKGEILFLLWAAEKEFLIKFNINLYTKNLIFRHYSNLILDFQ